MSEMRKTMATQPAALERVLADTEPVKRVAQLLAGRRVVVVGTGTSWHGANEGAWLLRQAGVDALAVQAADAAANDPSFSEEEVVVIVSHRGTKKFGNYVLRRRNTRADTVLISQQGNKDADLDTAPNEISSCHTASHLTAVMRFVQLAQELGADLGRVEDVPGAVAAELDRGPTEVLPPARLIEFAGVGVNAWVAAEAALKIREAAYFASEGMACETVLHGPAVALSENDALVCFSAGRERDNRLEELAGIVSTQGAAVYNFTRAEIGEALALFPLTVVAQKIAVEAAEQLGTNPDSFGLDLPGRADAWGVVEL